MVRSIWIWILLLILITINVTGTVYLKTPKFTNITITGGNTTSEMITAVNSTLFLRNWSYDIAGGVVSDIWVNETGDTMSDYLYIEDNGTLRLYSSDGDYTDFYMGNTYGSISTSGDTWLYYAPGNGRFYLGYLNDKNHTMHLRTDSSPDELVLGSQGVVRQVGTDYDLNIYADSGITRIHNDLYVQGDIYHNNSETITFGDDIEVPGGNFLNISSPDGSRSYRFYADNFENYFYSSHNFIINNQGGVTWFYDRDGTQTPQSIRIVSGSGQNATWVSGLGEIRQKGTESYLRFVSDKGGIYMKNDTTIEGDLYLKGNFYDNESTIITFGDDVNSTGTTYSEGDIITRSNITVKGNNIGIDNDFDYFQLMIFNAQQSGFQTSFNSLLFKTQRKDDDVAFMPNDKLFLLLEPLDNTTRIYTDLYLEGTFYHNNSEVITFGDDMNSTGDFHADNNICFKGDCKNSWGGIDTNLSYGGTISGDIEIINSPNAYMKIQSDSAKNSTLKLREVSDDYGFDLMYDGDTNQLKLYSMDTGTRREKMSVDRWDEGVFSIRDYLEIDNNDSIGRLYIKGAGNAYTWSGFTLWGNYSKYEHWGFYSRKHTNTVIWEYYNGTHYWQPQRIYPFGDVIIAGNTTIGKDLYVKGTIYQNNSEIITFGDDMNSTGDFYADSNICFKGDCKNSWSGIDTNLSSGGQIAGDLTVTGTFRASPWVHLNRTYITNFITITQPDTRPLIVMRGKSDGLSNRGGFQFKRNLTDNTSWFQGYETNDDAFLFEFYNESSDTYTKGLRFTKYGNTTVYDDLYVGDDLYVKGNIYHNNSETITFGDDVNNTGNLYADNDVRVKGNTELTTVDILGNAWIKNPNSYGSIRIRGKPSTQTRSAFALLHNNTATEQGWWFLYHNITNNLEWRYMNGTHWLKRFLIEPDSDVRLQKDLYVTGNIYHNNSEILTFGDGAGFLDQVQLNSTPFYGCNDSKEVLTTNETGHIICIKDRVGLYMIRGIAGNANPGFLTMGDTDGDGDNDTIYYNETKANSTYLRLTSDETQFIQGKVNFTDRVWMKELNVTNEIRVGTGTTPFRITGSNENSNVTFHGDVTINGTLDVKGLVNISGNLTLNERLNITTDGYIYANTVNANILQAWTNLTFEIPTSAVPNSNIILKDTKSPSKIYMGNYPTSSDEYSLTVMGAGSHKYYFDGGGYMQYDSTTRPMRINSKYTSVIISSTTDTVDINSVTNMTQGWHVNHATTVAKDGNFTTWQPMVINNSLVEKILTVSNGTEEIYLGKNAGAMGITATGRLFYFTLSGLSQYVGFQRNAELIINGDDGIYVGFGDNVIIDDTANVTGELFVKRLVNVDNQINISGNRGTIAMSDELKMGGELSMEHGDIIINGDLNMSNNCGIPGTLLQYERSNPSTNQEMATGNGDILRGTPQCSKGHVKAICGACENCNALGTNIAMEVTINGASQVCDTAYITTAYGTDCTTCDLRFEEGDLIGCKTKTESGVVTGLTCGIAVQYIGRT